MRRDEHQPCPLCGRQLVPGPSVDRHHLVPQLKGGTVADEVHRVCHGKIHATWDENQLRDHYDTWEKLRTAPEMQSFIRWVRKKPADFMDGTRMRNGHRRRRR